VWFFRFSVRTPPMNPGPSLHGFLPLALFWAILKQVLLQSGTERGMRPLWFSPSLLSLSRLSHLPMGMTASCSLMLFVFSRSFLFPSFFLHGKSTPKVFWLVLWPAMVEILSEVTAPHRVFYGIILPPFVHSRRSSLTDCPPLFRRNPPVLSCNLLSRSFP